MRQTFLIKFPDSLKERSSGSGKGLRGDGGEEQAASSATGVATQERVSALAETRSGE